MKRTSSGPESNPMKCRSASSSRT